MNRRVSIPGLLALLAATASVAGQAPQPSPQLPTFKSEVEYVDVDVIVTDAEGRFVRDLTRDDFQVFEDGRRQTVTNFTLVDIPVERPDRPLYSPTPVEPDVETNEPFTGRVYIIVLDDLHTDATRSLHVRRAARQFIERNLGANDLMAIVHTGGRVDAAQEFTSNKRLLLESVDKFVGRKLQSITAARSAEFFRMQLGGATGAVADPYDFERAANARTSMNMLRDVSQWLGGVRGRRKALLFISEGVDYDITNLIRDPYSVPSSASLVIDDIREAVLATARANVSVYGIDPRGLSGLGDENISISSFPNTQATPPPVDGQDAQPGPSGAGIGMSSLLNELRLSQDNLRTLSDESGGFAVVNANDFGRAFDRIVADNSSYYVLAYYPPSTKRDGRFHKIEVRTTRPGLTVRARRGYSAPKGNPPAIQDTAKANVAAPVLEAMNSPLPVSGMKMKVFAAPFKGEGRNASVLVGVELDGRDLTLADNGRVEVSYLAVDSKGKMRDGKTDVLSLNLRPETRARVQQTGLRSLGRLTLPPGRYQLRVGSLDASGAVGSVMTYLDIPDYAAAPFSMSGLVLTSMAGSGTITTRPDEQLKGVLPAPPVGLRTFPRNDEIALFAEVYDNQGNVPHGVDITATVTSDTGTVLYKHAEERSASELKGKSGGFGFVARIPVADLPVGRHVLTVEARSRLGDQTVSRQVQFTVVPPATPSR